MFKLRGKKGSIQISFGVIFSIIIIIAVIGVAFYVINYFLNLSKCTNVSLFYQEFQDEVDEAWNSEITRATFVGKLPGEIESVCFRDGESAGSGEEYEALSDYFRSRGNMFLYPPEYACKQTSRKVEHVDLSGLPNGWYCFSANNGEVRIPLEKGSFDALVKIKKE